MEDLVTDKLMDAVKYIRSIVEDKPTVGIILGSGLGALAYEIQNPIEIGYADIPFFKTSTVPGHEGKLIFGKIYDKNIVAMQGRLHYYEGYSMQDVVFPIRVFALLGVETLIVTNAAGGINPKFNPGDLMVITDHINMSGNSPLIGPNVEILGPRFPSMRKIYSTEYIEKIKGVAAKLKINLQEGVYAFMPGPQYETDAEVKMLETLGASAVGMSTVPEVIAAAHSSINVLGVSCITNMAGGGEESPSHKEVLDVASKAEEDFTSLILDTINEL